VLAALGGIVAAGALLWFGVIHPADQGRVEQLSQAWGGSQAASRASPSPSCRPTLPRPPTIPG
jgi:hypothetical protein